LCQIWRFHKHLRGAIIPGRSDIRNMDSRTRKVCQLFKYSKAPHCLSASSPEQLLSHCEGTASAFAASLGLC
jgi:hypothetical protein